MGHAVDQSILQQLGLLGIGDQLRLAEFFVTFTANALILAMPIITL